MDASQYKDYVLVLLFVKYVSDKYAGQKNPLIVIPEKGGFADMVALMGQKNIGDEMNKIIGRLAEANELKGVIDQADFNDEAKLGSGKEMVDRLSKLVAIFNRPELDFSRNRADGDDLLGDAYEYLMRNFATQSGKSKGQFYTPAEVSRVIAKVIGISHDTTLDQTIYDPTCGSGSLLLKAADEAPRGLTIYGQEKDNATAGLAKMNMFLHDRPGAEIFAGNTLTNPHFRSKDGGLRTFDFVVANPPFSDKAWMSGMDAENDEFGRFEYGVPPSKNGDYAYLLHILKSMNSTGSGDALKDNEPKRLALYKMAAALLRSYSNLASEMQEADFIKKEVEHYEGVRNEVKLASGDYIDLKTYGPAMRHLIDTYIRAEESEVISAFDDVTLVQLLVDRGPEAVDALPSNMCKSKEAVAEAIESNVRRLIIDESPINPKYYERMSELLDALVAERRSNALEYREYLERMAELARQASDPGTASYPPSIDTLAKRALFDNLGGDEKLAEAVDEAVRLAKMDDWQNNRIKTRKMLISIIEVLQDEARAKEILEVVKNQREYV